MKARIVEAPTRSRRFLWRIMEARIGESPTCYHHWRIDKDLISELSFLHFIAYLLVMCSFLWSIS
jgi:hypothetical protein